MKTKIAIIITMLLLTMSAYGAGKVYNYRLYDVREMKFDENFKIIDDGKLLRDCKYLKFSYYPPISGQSDVLMFVFEKTPNASGVSNLPSIWFEKGKSSYKYIWNKFSNGAVCRVLYLYSDDFPDEWISISISSNYKGKCKVGVKGSNYKYTQGDLSVGDSEAFFKMVARLVRGLKIPKTEDSLYIDVNF